MWFFWVYLSHLYPRIYTQILKKKCKGYSRNKCMGGSDGTWIKIWSMVGYFPFTICAWWGCKMIQFCAWWVFLKLVHIEDMENLLHYDDQKKCKPIFHSYGVFFSARKCQKSPLKHWSFLPSQTGNELLPMK